MSETKIGADPVKKRVLTEAQLENLARAREKAAENRKLKAEAKKKEQEEAAKSAEPEPVLEP